MQQPSRLISTGIVIALFLALAVVAGLVHLNIPTSAAGMAAKLVCSGTFVAGRNPQDVLLEDVKPASIVMQAARVHVDMQRKLAVGYMPGSVERYAIWKQGRGCTLLDPGKLPDLPGQRQMVAGTVDPVVTPATAAYKSAPFKRQMSDEKAMRPWPDGKQVTTSDRWPAEIDKVRLQKVVDDAFATPAASSFSPTTRRWKGQNTRAVLIAHRGKLLIDRYGGGFDRDTPQLGWSMTKSVLSALIWKHFREREIDLDTPVIELMQRMPRVAWAAEWLRDDRASIRLSDLLRMRDGLDHKEGYAIWSWVPYMLFSLEDVGQYAGSVGTIQKPGTTWRYSSAVSNLASRVLRDQFTTDDAYWQFPDKQLFGPIGASSAVLETDANGTFIGSSYMWATAQDWLRVGQLLANDGRWGDKQVFPQGWLGWATKAEKNSDGKSQPYGAHVWLTHANNTLDCNDNVGLPANGFLFKGHMGQILAVFPEQELVMLRLGWTVDTSRWDDCEFLGNVLGSVDSAR